MTGDEQGLSIAHFAPEVNVEGIAGGQEARPPRTTTQAVSSVSNLVVRAVQLWDFDSLPITSDLDTK